MNKFLSSISNGGVTKEEVLQIIEDTSVTYNEDSTVSINNSSNASIYITDVSSIICKTSSFVMPPLEMDDKNLFIIIYLYKILYL